DGRAAPRLPRRPRVPVPAAAGTGGPVEAVVPAVLVAHLVGHVVDVEVVSHRVAEAGHAHGLLAVHAHDAQAGDAAAAGAEHVADVVVGVPDHGVQVGLVLAQHLAAVVVGVGVRGPVQVDHQVVVGHQVHVHREVALVHLVDPVDRVRHLGHGARKTWRVRLA